MRKLLQKLFRKPVSWMALKFSSSPKKSQVFKYSIQLLEKIQNEKQASTPSVPFDMATGKFIILSDQHKGSKDLARRFSQHREELHGYPSILLR